jgi:hypothetical protein
MNTQPFDSKSDKIVAVCFRCVCGLTVPQVAESIEGQFIKYDERGRGTVVLYMCNPCMQQTDKICAEGIDGAKKRMQGAVKTIDIIAS